MVPSLVLLWVALRAMMMDNTTVVQMAVVKVVMMEAWSVERTVELKEMMTVVWWVAMKGYCLVEKKAEKKAALLVELASTMVEMMAALKAVM